MALNRCLSNGAPLNSSVQPAHRLLGSDSDLNMMSQELLMYALIAIGIAFGVFSLLNLIDMKRLD
jgi:hypothetical protein